MEGGLIRQRSGENRVTVRLAADRQSFEPYGPTIRQKSFHSNLVDHQITIELFYLR